MNMNTTMYEMYGYAWHSMAWHSIALVLDGLTYLIFYVLATEIG